MKKKPRKTMLERATRAALLKKELIEALREMAGEVDMRVPNGSVNIGALCDMALIALSKQRVPAKKFRYCNAVEVTLWQKKACWESGLGRIPGGANLVWVNAQDVLEMGLEVKPEKQETGR